MATAHITSLYRYPVKGLTAERLDGGIDLTPGGTIPFDRAYAIENGPGSFEEAAPRHLPKIAFLCVMRDARLAGLHAAFDEAGGRHRLTLSRGGAELATGELATPHGRAALEAFFAREFAAELRGRPRIVQAPGHSFSDVREKCVHILNLQSLRMLEITLGMPLDPLRFRPNLIVDGLKPYAELDLVGRTLSIGNARLEIFKRTMRCAATDVDPSTAIRRGDLPGHLAATLGHRDFGIYATVTCGGRIAHGDEVAIT